MGDGAGGPTLTDEHSVGSTNAWKRPPEVVRSKEATELEARRILLVKPVKSKMMP